MNKREESMGNSGDTRHEFLGVKGVSGRQSRLVSIGDIRGWELVRLQKLGSEYDV